MQTNTTTGPYIDDGTKSTDFETMLPSTADTAGLDTTAPATTGT